MMRILVYNQDFEVNSLHFRNQNKQKIYKKKKGIESLEII